MRRGEVWLADLEPVRGSESNKRRPVIVVMNDRAAEAAAELGRGVVTVVPVTSNVRRVMPFQVGLPAGSGGLRIKSKAQAEQLRSLDFGRFVHRLGQLPAELVRELDEALALHLGLN